MNQVTGAVEVPMVLIEYKDSTNAWHPLEFYYYPSSVKSVPHFVAPYAPRLDWQMWFAALSSNSHRAGKWFEKFCVEILNGNDRVFELIKTEKKDLKAIRANLHFFRMTNMTEFFQTGNFYAIAAGSKPSVFLKEITTSEKKHQPSGGETTTMLLGLIPDSYDNRFYVAFACFGASLIARRVQKRRLAYLATLPVDDGGAEYGHMHSHAHEE